MSAHHCHARGCDVPVRPELLMCFKHWRIVPRGIQLSVYHHYRNGQCDDKKVSPEWLRAADAAIAYVAMSEGRPLTARDEGVLKVYGFDPESKKGK